MFRSCITKFESLPGHVFSVRLSSLWNWCRPASTPWVDISPPTMTGTETESADCASRAAGTDFKVMCQLRIREEESKRHRNDIRAAGTDCREELRPTTDVGGALAHSERNVRRPLILNSKPHTVRP